MNKMTVVVIEDDNAERNNLIKFFKSKEDCEVVGFASDGLSGIAEIESKKPDLVILDIVISKVDGYEVLGHFGKEKCKSKFLVYSALSHDSFVSKAFMCGADYYLVKPTDYKIIYERAKEILNRPYTNSNSNFENMRKSDNSKKSRSLEEQLSNVFVTVGIPANLKGYQFLREGIRLTVDNPMIINNITKQLYPAIAVKFDTSSSKVERAIRHAIEVAWNRGKIENINNWYGIKVYSAFEKPTNGEFIALIADKMLLETF